MLLIVSLVMSGAPVSLHLRAVNNSIVVGEPLRFELRWEARQDVQVPSPPGLGAPAPVEIRIAHSQGKPRIYREASLGVAEEMSWRPPLPAGSTEYWDVILHHGWYEPFQRVEPKPPTLAFSKAGAYSVIVRYGLAAGGVVESNQVTVRVRDANDGELEVLKSLQGNLIELKYGGPVARELLARHPNNPQLSLARVYSVGEAMGEIAAGRDPDTREPLMGPTRERMDETRRDRHREIVQRLDREDWGVYEDQRLMLLASIAGQIGDAATASRASSKLKQLFPNSPAALSLRPPASPPALRDPQ